MRVLIQNLFGRGADWSARRNVFLRGLRELRPDLVAFQEAVVNQDYEQLVDLLGPDFHVLHQKARSRNAGGRRGWPRHVNGPQLADPGRA